MNRTLVLAIALAFPFSSGTDAADTIYQSPVSPGANPAAVPAPRTEWFETVQKRFDQYSGKHLKIVFDGDSITNRWQTTGREIWDQRYAGIAADFGMEGDRVENVRWRLEKGQVDGIDPEIVVLMIGTNNGVRDSADQIAMGIKALVTDYKNRCPHARIILMGVFPRAAAPTDPARLKMAAVNSQIALLADGKRVYYVDIGPRLIGPNGAIAPDMMPDFLHPTLKGYRIWADAIQPLIDSHITSKSASPVAAASARPAAANTALITFSGLYDTANSSPVQGEIPDSYQPLLSPAPQNQLPDGSALHVTVEWGHALSSNRGVNPGVHDHTGDGKDDRESVGGGVMFGTSPFTMTFSQPVEVPSFFWTYYSKPTGLESHGTISAYQHASDKTAVKSVELSYAEDRGYVWQPETAFTGLHISKLVFDPGKATDTNNPALNIDDITVRTDSGTKP